MAKPKDGGEKKASRNSSKHGGSKSRGETKKKIVLKRKPCPIQGKVFPDASKMEKDLLVHGTIKDKIDVLTLLTERNPSAENYKGLLAFCENQRNDVHYYALKNIKDLLISKREVGNPYIKQRIVKSFGVNLRNQYIKKKVIRLVEKLLEKGVLFVDLIHLFINKLGDKKDTTSNVIDKLHLLFPGNEETILDGVEDFYFKNDLFRSRHVVLKFLSKLDCENKRKAFEVFNNILRDFNENIPEEHRNILLEDLIIGLGKNMTDEKVCRMDIIRKAVHTEKMIFYGSKVLSNCKDSEMILFFKNAIRSYKMRNSKHLPEFLNMVHKAVSADEKIEFHKFLLDTSLLYTPEYIISILIICSEARKAGISGFDNIHSLRILALHHNDAVRGLALQLISDEAIHPFDPFDKMSLLNAEMMCGNL
ncbi:Nucleic-acid-binding protein [Encephalitozoon romaleae SJ-2008]|uniref:Nucleic-acid-binding protein n=1 Tax=Encephalitozoon romaleae (strain SJ-2008) TaxID=1178016 RepID=I7AQE6_ENCRO|nr:Nucleic-acid-binding protein [Encephalitozoon romaleae SJ-2008]AFN82537.1 Nucleic-acid-binding protein [Encephalitozoon romaleae SJ-2008]